MQSWLMVVKQLPPPKSRLDRIPELLGEIGASVGAVLWARLTSPSSDESERLVSPLSPGL